MASSICAEEWTAFTALGTKAGVVCGSTLELSVANWVHRRRTVSGSSSPTHLAVAWGQKWALSVELALPSSNSSCRKDEIAAIEHWMDTSPLIKHHHFNLFHRSLYKGVGEETSVDLLQGECPPIQQHHYGLGSNIFLFACEGRTPSHFDNLVVERPFWQARIPLWQEILPLLQTPRHICLHSGTEGAHCSTSLQDWVSQVYTTPVVLSVRTRTWTLRYDGKCFRENRIQHESWSEPDFGLLTTLHSLFVPPKELPNLMCLARWSLCEGQCKYPPLKIPYVQHAKGNHSNRTEKVKTVVETNFSSPFKSETDRK